MDLDNFFITDPKTPIFRDALKSHASTIVFFRFGTRILIDDDEWTKTLMENEDVFDDVHAEGRPIIHAIRF